MCEKIMRKCGIYLVTIVLLSISFGVVYGLSLAQVENSENLALSLVISLFIGVINLLIGSKNGLN